MHLSGILGSAITSSLHARLLSCTATFRMVNWQGQPRNSKSIDPYSWAGRMLLGEEPVSAGVAWERGHCRKIKHSPRHPGLFPTHVLRATWKREKKSPLLRGYHWFGSRLLAKEAPAKISPDILDVN